MTCPRCGADASGAFCSNCGAELKSTRNCVRCEGALPAGARYCIQCGAPAGGHAALLRWGVPALVAVVALGVGYWLGSENESPSAAAAQPPFATAPAGMGAPPPLTGSMRDQADRLFERIMQARARGDTAEARFFLPMALQAYEGSAPLDADGHFHVGLLQLGAGRIDDARATARSISAADSSHLFGFALAGEAALEAGDASAARAAFSGLLTRFDTELARGLPEYEMHRPALDEYRERARSMVGE